LKPGETCIAEVYNDAVSGASYPYYTLSNLKFEISGQWKVTFIDGGPELPATANIDKLVSWTEFAGETGKKFSGTAIYEITFAKPKAKCDGWILDLGKICESAKVSLNGSVIDTLIGPDFRLVLPKSTFKKENKLEIAVSNLMANRIIDLDKNGVNWKKFYNTNFQTRIPENRDANGLFSAAKWQPKVSGLLGPVVLIPIQNIK
jgi:hypothetical protein